MRTATIVSRRLLEGGTPLTLVTSGVPHAVLLWNASRVHWRVCLQCERLSP
ncbi:MAG: hypothetical protein ACYCUE_07180 [Steroidobacteraceae bacterium]